MEAWYLVYSKPRQEQVAVDNLGRQGFAVYCPRIRSRRRRRGRFVAVIEPIFPRYLFVHLNDETDDWGPIRSTRGVVNLVRYGGYPARVPDNLIAALRDREDEMGVQVLAQPELRDGDRVRIVEGLLAGYEAIFQARTGKERVRLLLDVAGRCDQVEMQASQIERGSFD